MPLAVFALGIFQIRSHFYAQDDLDPPVYISHSEMTNVYSTMLSFLLVELGSCKLFA
jgi:hypothetical protein